ncbi:MAG: 3-hydroxybutyrate dehydrogenase [Alphaproteobacteria bacterium]|nr:3-hydroxybutyrate dehydrogenase [Alphaproteobacteria bacterium]
MSLTGKTALITGSTSGIGFGVAQCLAEKGANIVLNGFGDAAEIEKMRNAIANDYGVNCIYVAADLSSEEGVKALFDDMKVQGVNGADIIVNNAGIQHVSPIEDFPSEKWQLIQDLMLSAPFYIIKCALPFMRKNGWGRIINIASVHGKVASMNKSAYVAAKHGLIGLGKVVALETAKENITCNSICPGWVLTPLVEKQVDLRAEQEGLSWDEAKMSLLSEKQPSVEFAKPEQIGALVSFLCSDDAAQITGSELTIDGGWTAQ